MGGFSDPIIGGGGALVYPSIHSPNFAANAAGWSINKDGTAQFAGITLLSGLQLGYSPAPGAGNLIASIAEQGGTDQFGNAYLAGETSYFPANGTAISNNGGQITFWTGPAGGGGPWVNRALTDFSVPFSAVEILGGAVEVGASAGADRRTVFLAPSGDATGVTDRTTIALFLGVGTAVRLLPGSWHIDQTVTLGTDGGCLTGSGAATVINTGSAWVPGAGTTPAIDVRARDCTVSSMKFGAIDGWGLRLINLTPAGAHQVNHQCHFSDLWFVQGCAGGLLIDGQQDTVGVFLRGLHFNRIGGGTAGTLDALQLLDCFDVDGVTIAPSVDGGTTTGHGIRMIGKTANVRLADMDCGGFPTPAVNSGQAGVRCETGAHGSPKTIRISNSIFQTWDTGASIAAGSDIVFTDCDFNSANTNGATVASTGNDIHFRGCRFGVAAANGVGGATAGANLADLAYTVAPHTDSPDCIFASPIVAAGTGGGVQASISLSARNQDAEFPNARFTGAGSAVANWFTGIGGLPRFVRSPGTSPGLTARQPAIAASTTPVINDTGFDCTIYIVPNTLTAVAVAGTVLAGLPLIVRVPANATITLTYPGAAPTWQWFGD